MEDSKVEFRKEYTRWIKSAARDISFTLNQHTRDELRDIISRNDQYLKEPESVYGSDGLEKVKKLVPDNILLLSTDAIVFSQSIFANIYGVFDYAVALNRRYYLGSWFSILTFNRAYIEEATETMLVYTVQHELLQKEIFEENIQNGTRKFSHGEKRKISNDALKKAIEISGITQDELDKENRLMLKISHNSPTIPKPFAETALYLHLEKNMECFRHFGEKSRTGKEEDIGKKLNLDFKEWIGFSTDTYRLFLSEVKKELDYMDYGYA
ncbi:MAG: hypothetical protein IBX39_10185 [Candidatus Methanoperedenaceae archaeon]|nr:hypothetical protein [Candidatus Methanoperedenaceae archaeon]MDW7726779.1 hypothetical protein [Candidatus Methanoperedens sp.]